ncbi:MAG: glycoside hydrolase family 3 N-terminal domain-containing protein [Micromonosporaceae bacterium]
MPTDYTPESEIDRGAELADLRWRDPAVEPRRRVDDLLRHMTLEEKVAQLYGVWVGADADGDGVAPHQHDMMDAPVEWRSLLTRGLGQLTRPFGTAPVDPALGARALARSQAEIVAAGRFGIPAIVHEECLAGLTTWGATIYPVPLAWGATFDPALIQRMAAEIGACMRSLGVHQGLAPVLDVVRDPRWGRTEETIGEDPYLVGVIGAAYVRGLESAGVVATLKHFVGYSASRAARNLAPVSMGPRELADVLLVPFEMALREGGARSVMGAYTDLDGLPSAVDDDLLTELLRDQWGFTGTVVADYFGVSFLETLHGVAADPGEAAGLALGAGVDIELPTVRCFGEPLIAAVRVGRVPESLVDRAARRVLLQKCDLGLLDPGWTPAPTAVSGRDGASLRGTVDLDPPGARATASRIAEESIILLSNDGMLPLEGHQGALAVVGPLADDDAGMLGCYSFPSHVGRKYPDVPLGVRIPTPLAALREEFPCAAIEHVPGCSVSGDDLAGIGDAVSAAKRSAVCVAVFGDRAGLFGRGTSGEGCDAGDLSLPGVQGQLLDALLDAGTPVVLVLLSGRPYALGRYAGRAAAIVQAFFPGEEGAAAVAGVLSGRINPSGRLPVGIPRSPGGQPITYLAPRLGRFSDVSATDPTPIFAFGHGMSYTTFAWTDPRVNGSPVGAGGAPVWDTRGEVRVACTIRNTGGRPGTETVQLYLHDPVAQVARPLVSLIGFARVDLKPGEHREVEFTVHADLTSYTGRGGKRIVEPGEVQLRLSSSSAEVSHALSLRLAGPTRKVGAGRQLFTAVKVTPAR